MNNLHNKNGAMSKRKAQGYYCVDRTLAPRIRLYLDSCQYRPDVEDVLDYLQSTFPEYKRKKRNALRQAVYKALENPSFTKKKTKTDNKLEEIENRYLMKQQKKQDNWENTANSTNDVEIVMDSSDSEDDGEEDLVEYKDQNAINNSIHNLYRPQVVSSPSISATGTQVPGNLPRLINSNEAENLLAWSIDKRGNQERQWTQLNDSQITSKVSNSATITDNMNHPTIETGQLKAPNYPNAVASSVENAFKPIIIDETGSSSPPVQITSMPSPNTLARCSPSRPRGDPAKRSLASIDLNRNSTVTVVGKWSDLELNKSKPRVDSSKESDSEMSKSRLSVVSEEENGPSRSATPSKKFERSKKKQEKVSTKTKKFEPTESSTSFQDIGGCDSTLQEVSKLLLHLKHPEVFSQLGIKPPRGFLLHGPPGCGKTLLANAIAGELKVPFYKIAATEVVSGISGDSEQRIRQLFSEATAMAPSIIFIDEIDSITPKRENASKEMERRVVTQILTCMDDLSSTDSHVLVIGATNRADTLDPALRRAGRFDREITMGIPDKKARSRILKVICRDLRLAPDFDFDQIASLTPGFVGADIQALAREAAMCAVDSAFQSLDKTEPLYSSNEDVVRTHGETSAIPEESATAWLRDQPPLSESQLSALFITTQHFQSALPNVQPSAKREGFATVPDVTWKDVGALNDIREELSMAIMAPVQNPHQFEALGLTTPPGILLCGPPGCGKTLLAKAIANEAGINFISVKGPELLNMYVGESEKAVRQVFERARNSSPCVIFFDEIDALCPKRSNTGDSTASSRVVNQLLTEMDGLQARKQVFILGATNRPDILDSAILRPGRLDKLLYVGLPDSADRADILNTLTKNGKKPLLAPDVCLKELSKDERCEGFSGADLAALVRDASVAALKEFMSSGSNEPSQNVTAPPVEQEQSDHHSVSEDCPTPPYTGNEPASNVAGDLSSDDAMKSSNSTETRTDPVISGVVVCRRHFDVAFEKVKPSVSGKDRIYYEDLKRRSASRS